MANIPNCSLFICFFLYLYIAKKHKAANTIIDSSHNALGGIFSIAPKKNGEINIQIQNKLMYGCLANVVIIFLVRISLFMLHLCRLCNLLSLMYVQKLFHIQFLKISQNKTDSVKHED